MAVAACCLVDLHSLAGLASFDFAASFADFDPKFKQKTLKKLKPEKIIFSLLHPKCLAIY